MREAFINLAVIEGRVQQHGNVKQRVPTTLFDHHTGAANTGTSETDLYVDVITTDVMQSIGDKVEARYGGNVRTTSSAVRLRLYLTGTLVFDTGSVTFAAVSGWAFYLTAIRTGVDTATVMVTLAAASTSIKPAQVTELQGLDFTQPLELKLTGQSAGVTGDLVAKLGYVEYKPRVQSPL